MQSYPPYLNVIIRRWIKFLLDKEVGLEKGQCLQLPKYIYNGERHPLWLKLVKGEKNSTYVYSLDLCSSTFNVELFRIQEDYRMRKINNQVLYFEKYYENLLEETIYQIDIANKISHVVGEKEIFLSYENPIDFRNYFSNIYKLESNLDVNPINYEDKEKWWVNSSYLKQDDLQVEFTIEKIICHKAFVNLLDVKIVEIKEFRSTRRRDSWTFTKTHCLYFKGIRIDDGYLSSILPEPKVFYDSEYNDSTPGRFGTEKSYKNSRLETERFLSNYDIHSHLRFLGPHFDPDFLVYRKLDKQTVYHEFGHLFGLCVSRSLGYFVADVANINLVYDYQNPGIKLKNNPFTHKNDLPSSQKLTEIHRIQIELKRDIKRVLSYILYLVSGAVFNVFYFKRKPVFEDFHVIFLDDEDAIKHSKPDSRAGNDYTKIKNLQWDVDWGQYDFSNFKFFALELFYILDKNSIFNVIEKDKLLENFDDNFNGKFTPGTDEEVKSLISEIENKLKLPGVLTDIEMLLEKYLHQINQC